MPDTRLPAHAPAWADAAKPASGVAIGLLLERGCDALAEKAEGAQKHFLAVAGQPEPPGYSAWFATWRSALDGLRGPGASWVTRFARVETDDCRLSVGLGAESVVETSIALHRTYGVPVIPGSALKGLARRYAAHALSDAWSANGEAFRKLYGAADEELRFRGLVNFHDALAVPGAWRLLHDTITVHHPHYYRGDPDAAPTDWEDPSPVPFLTVAGAFELALTGPEEWVRAAGEILRLALAEEGIGAKTGAGYGRMRLRAEWLGDAAVVAKSRAEPAPAPVQPPNANKQVEAVLLEERTKAGGWKAKHEATGLSGPIQNSDHVALGCKAGDRVSLIVAAVGTREIAFRWPTEEELARVRKSQARSQHRSDRGNRARRR